MSADDLVRLTHRDLELLRHRNTIAALQSRNDQLGQLLQDEKAARRDDAKKHSKVVKELNNQIHNQDAGKYITELEAQCESLSETCAALSLELRRAEQELTTERMNRQ
jgi:c-di-GMP-related signal transduction protein